MSPMRTHVAANPAARVDSKVELAADHTHAEVAEAFPVSAHLAATVVCRELVLASDVSASFVQEDLDEVCLREVDVRVEEGLNTSLYNHKDLELHSVSSDKRL